MQRHAYVETPLIEEAQQGPQPCTKRSTVIEWTTIHEYVGKSCENLHICEADIDRLSHNTLHDKQALHAVKVKS